MLRNFFLYCILFLLHNMHLYVISVSHKVIDSCTRINDERGSQLFFLINHINVIIQRQSIMIPSIAQSV
jgi:hypothetical protein